MKSTWTRNDARQRARISERKWGKEIEKILTEYTLLPSGRWRGSRVESKMRRITNAEHNKENRASATVGISGIILGRVLDR